MGENINKTSVFLFRSWYQNTKFLSISYPTVSITAENRSVDKKVKHNENGNNAKAKISFEQSNAWKTSVDENALYTRTFCSI